MYKIVRRIKIILNIWKMILIKINYVSKNFIEYDSNV